MPVKRVDRYDALLTATCFLGSLALYTRTLVPGLLPGDSGEFQTLAYLLGHTHPTGYPVYLALAKLVTFLPLGDIAYRVNLLSALMASLTVAGVYLGGRLLVNYRLPALVGAMVLAVSPTFWTQAVIAEVYTAGAAFMIVILLALLWWDRTGEPRILFFAGTLGGLSLGVHMGVALLAPAVLLFLSLYRRSGVRMWKHALAGAVTGFSITIIMFWLIDLHNPTANYFNAVIEPSRSAWGLSADEIDGPLERLLFDWSARQFRSFMFADIARVMPEQAAKYWQNLPFELGWPLVWFSLLGSADLLVRRARAGALLFLGLAVQLICTFNYAIWDLYVFFIPGYVLLVLLAIAGMGTATELGETFLIRATSGSRIRWLKLAVEGTLSLLVFGLAVRTVFQQNKDAALAGKAPLGTDRHAVNSEFLLETSKAMVDELPESSIVFADWDRIWPYYYAAHVLEGRTDLTFIETHPADDVSGVADSLIVYVGTNLKYHPTFFSEREPALIAAGYAFSPRRFGPIRLYQILDN